MTVQISTDAGFADLTSKGLVLVDFWAEWCGPCKMMLPRLDELATRIGDSAIIAKHNVDTDSQIPASMRVMSIPTMILFKDGQPVEKWVGVQEVETLADAIAKHQIEIPKTEVVATTTEQTKAEESIAATNTNEKHSA